MQTKETSVLEKSQVSKKDGSIKTEDFMDILSCIDYSTDVVSLSLYFSLDLLRPAAPIDGKNIKNRTVGF